ncbi:MAG TPA: hypothetical protein VLV49_11240 [Terriglobales bacterium]|nr:hypothetical protein [Terriglobales bacterium]
MSNEPDKMATMRMPLWIKLLWSVWVAVWAPLYWWHYGAQNLLFFCDLGNFLVLAALWLESPLLFSAEAAGLLLFQTLFTIDLAGAVLTGRHLIGGTEFMFDPHVPLPLRLLSLFHVVMPPVLLWGVWRLGYQVRGWKLQTLLTWMVVPVNYFWRPQYDINWARGLFFREQHLLPGWLYLGVYLVVVPAVVYWPTHRLLRWWAGNGGGPAGSTPTLSPFWKHLRGHWFFDLVQICGAVLAIDWSWFPPVPGYAVGVLAVLAAAMSVHIDMHRLQKAVWMVLIGAFLVVEFAAIGEDRAQNQMRQAVTLGAERREFGKVLSQNQRHFESTMNSTKGVLKSLDMALLQAMGGSGYPVFVPVAPSSPSRGTMWPVAVVYHLSDQNDRRNLPLLDVSVDVREDLPERPIAKIDSTTRSRIAESQFHPAHFDLGSLVPPSNFITPIRLYPGRRYEFTITTRRGLFREYVSIEPQPASPGGWHPSWCLYRYRDNELLDGKCD